MGFFRDVFDLIFLSRKKRIDKSFVKMTNKLEYIELLNEGFQVKSKQKGVFIQKRWKEIKDAIYNEEKIIVKTDKQEFTITSEMIGWYIFIQEIPTGFPSFDYKALNNFFSSLIGCKCCGLIAFNKKECLNCIFKPWNDELAKEYNSKEEYLKECQLEEFETTNELGEFEITNKPQYGFKSDPTWKPVITLDELEKYSND